MIADRVRRSVAARTYSLLMTMGAVAQEVAPLFGGALLGTFGWRGVFGALTVIVVMMLLGAFFVLPETLPRSRRWSGLVSATLRGARSLLVTRQYLGYTLGTVFCTPR